MARIIFKFGEKVMETELKAGQRILEAGYNVGIDNEQDYGLCGGNCSCATCHVYVETGAELFDEPSPYEDMMLDGDPATQENSRLSCQLVVKPQHEDVVVRVPQRSFV